MQGGAYTSLDNTCSSLVTIEIMRNLTNLLKKRRLANKNVDHPTHESIVTIESSVKHHIVLTSRHSVNVSQIAFKAYHMIIWHKKQSYLEQTWEPTSFVEKGPKIVLEKLWSKRRFDPPIHTTRSSRILHKIIHLGWKYQWSFHHKITNSECFHKKDNMGQYEGFNKSQCKVYSWARPSKSIHCNGKWMKHEVPRLTEAQRSENIAKLSKPNSPSKHVVSMTQQQRILCCYARGRWRSSGNDAN